LRQARAHAPNDPELLVGHGSVLLQMRHTQAACQTFAAAARLAPRYLMAHVNHAVALLLLGEAELAEAAALRAASVDPGHDEVLKLLGHLRLRSLRRPPHVAPA
jgi:Flp pilus assembly protein TadD